MPKNARTNVDQIERTDEEMIFADPLVITLGAELGEGRTFTVRPLPIRRSREWRKEAAGLLKDLQGDGVANGASAGDVLSVLERGIREFPDKAYELVYPWSPDMENDREWIEDNATEKEMVDAVKAVLKIAFPLTGALGDLGAMSGVAAPKATSI